MPAMSIVNTQNTGQSGVSLNKRNINELRLSLTLYREETPNILKS